MPPTRSNSLSCSARRSFTCISIGISPISSRKSVPPLASSKRPGLLATAPGERAALVAEELALDELLGDRGAVDLDEGLVLAARVLVERAGDELLARAALAGDEHRRRRVGDALEDGVELGDARWSVADDAEARAPRRRTPASRRRRASSRVFSALATIWRTSSLSNGLVTKSNAPLFSASTAVSIVPCAVMSTTGSSGSSSSARLEQRHPVDLGHLQVGDDQVDVVLLEQRRPLLAVLRRQHVVPVARELRGQDLPQVRLVVDDEDLFALGKHATPAAYHHAVTTTPDRARRDPPASSAAGCCDGTRPRTPFR